jgi:uncharacterized protein with FMN-binding domain
VSPRLRPTHPLVALSSAAVVAVYTAGFLKTRAVAAKFSDAPAMARPAAMSATGPLVKAPVEHEPVIVPKGAAPVPAKPRKPKAAQVEAHATGHDVGAAITTEAHDVAEPVVVEHPSVDLTPTSAAITIAPPPSADPAPKAQWHDGTFSGWGSSRHGDIQATVVIESGRVTSARISQCLTRYSCSWIAYLQGQVVDRQSADVDYVSGATQSSNAFYWAIVDALTKAAK